MAQRMGHLVGSIPAPDAESAMRLALDALGPSLQTLTDGETGERRNWIVSVIEELRDHPDLEVARDGDFSDYDRIPRLRVRKGRKLYGATLDFGHVAAVEQSWPVFSRLRTEYARPGLSFQVGVPGDFDMAAFTLGPREGLRHRRAFTEATLAEIGRVFAAHGRDVVFQIEAPAELVQLARVPEPLAPAAARVLARGVLDLAAGAPEGARFGVHLCLGDMNHRALGRMQDAAPLVHLANAIARGWPAGRALEFVHAPFTGGEDPPPTEPAFYAPLERLRLPTTTRFVAGFAHEGQGFAEQLEVLRLIEERVDRPVGVSNPCGLGRRSPSAGRAAMERIAELCAA
ncbi:hypothetical protein [Motilibacter deserti]|uniref:Cobalamin-independent methionine synthase MetE C-terminal/archaeal domain-containing protein n=1 Tax=Motilibacter deserti TaxID=2714956 RepID=A0ABX0GQM0_9ACTN|nr:hypothetical protein [Motilibacter deserti]NHC12174.1 hypothetical protein [Motilibacter deserti]